MVIDEPVNFFVCVPLSVVCLQEHQHKQCEMLLIEQALTVVEGHGDDTTTIQIPVGHLGGDTTQLLVDGKHVNVLDNMNFEQVSAVTGRWRCSCRTFCSLVCVFINMTQFFPLWCIVSLRSIPSPCRLSYYPFAIS